MPVNQRGRRGFTLVELIVVLAILAILTTMAMTSTSGIVDQTRYEETIGLINRLEYTIFGNLHGDGSSYGFVSDIGDFPLNANELLIPAGFTTSYQDPNTGLVAGWNGPYLHPADGETSVRDGWGNDVEIGLDTGDPNLCIIRSFGRDGQPGGMGIDGDIVRSYERFKDPLLQQGSDIYGTIYFNFINNTGLVLNKVEVYVHCPQKGFVMGDKFWSTPQSTVTPGEEIEGSFLFKDQISSGFRAIRISYEFQNGNPPGQQVKIIRIIGGGSSSVHFNLN